jgi:hypothetical protein
VTRLPTQVPDAAAEVDESQKSLSLMSVAKSDDAEAGILLDEPKTPGKVLNKGSLLILLLFVVAAGVLYAMRARHNSGAASVGNKEAEAKIEQKLVQLTMPGGIAPGDSMSQASLAALFKDTDAIVRRFSADPTERLVPIEQVKKNPFVLPVYESAASPVAAPVQAQTTKKAPKVDEGVKLEQELKGLKLTSVMTGRTRVAVINSQFLQEGQKIGSFTVKSITSTGVTLESNGKAFPLSMDDKPGPPSIRGK